MRLALTRAVSPNLNRCELEFQERREIDSALAARQHREYERALQTLGLRVISLPADPDLPDSVFVEDPAIVLDEIAVICRSGAISRRNETKAIAGTLAKYRELFYIEEPATIEGGDVLRIGKTLFVGLSRRTNREGIAQLTALVASWGYRVVAVPVFGSLHLKSAVCELGDGVLLVNRSWFDFAAMAAFDFIDAPDDEPASANVLRIGGKVLMPASFPRTRELLEKSGFKVTTVDISELQKAEAGVTCSSLIFDSHE